MNLIQYQLFKPYKFVVIAQIVLSWQISFCCDGSTITVLGDGADMHRWLLLARLSSAIVRFPWTASETDIWWLVEHISNLLILVVIIIVVIIMINMNNWTFNMHDVTQVNWRHLQYRRVTLAIKIQLSNFLRNR